SRRSAVTALKLLAGERPPTTESTAGSPASAYEGRLASVSETVCRVPFRVNVTVTLSPGLRALIAVRSWSGAEIFVPPSEVITSPAGSPAFAAGVPALTETTRALAVLLPSSTPRYACCAWPFEISCDAIDLIVFDGIANPTPSLPPESLSIWAFTPMTCAWSSSSGPPELPWLIAASVWIESSIAKLFGEVICRCSALTIPAVTVSASPNGEPIATTLSPTWTLFGSPTVRGERTEEGASTLSTARSVDASVPTTCALYELPFQNVTCTEVAPSTTC